MVMCLQRSWSMIEIRRILCPVDCSDASMRALRHASALAGWYESALTTLYLDTELPIDSAMMPQISVEAG